MFSLNSVSKEIRGKVSSDFEWSVQFSCAVPYFTVFTHTYSGNGFSVCDTSEYLRDSVT